MGVYASSHALSSIFFFFVFLVLSYSTPLVLSTWTISELPGFNGPLPFFLETGYVVVDEVNDGQLFYYFVKSERNPEEDPLLLWLTGGPGCSAFSGMTTEIGPIQFEKVEYNGSIPNLVLNPYSWSKISSIIFVDSPIGTGFSFSRSSEDYLIGDIVSSKQVYKFLRKWFLDHTEFLSNPLYISGDSYSGKVIPIITQLISEGIEDRHEPIMNLEGYLVGNPVVRGDLVLDISGLLMAYSFGLISSDYYESLKENCDGQTHNNISQMCAQNLATYVNLLSGVSMTEVLEYACTDETIVQESYAGNRRALHENHKPINPPDIRCNCYSHYLCYIWANFEISRRALHVQRGTVGEWLRCKSFSSYEMIPSSINFYFNLTKKEYRGLVYSGDHDMIAPHLSTQEWIRSFNLSTIDNWRQWWVDGQVAGYMRTYSNNLTFATVKGGGHTAPEYRPKECFSMIERWLTHKTL